MSGTGTESTVQVADTVEVADDSGVLRGVPDCPGSAGP